ncbi:hypothetical protein Tco_0753665 [Tanacetum coccineum]
MFKNYLDSVRGELKEELKEEMKVNLKEEMCEELKEEMKNELKEEMREELKEEMHEELKEEMRAEIQDMLVEYGIKSLVTRQTKTKQDAFNYAETNVYRNPKLHRQFENYAPYEMLQELKSMFEKQAGVERFDLIQTFHAYKQEEGKPFAAYVLQMKGYVD